MADPYSPTQAMSAQMEKMAASKVVEIINTLLAERVASPPIIIKKWEVVEMLLDAGILMDDIYTKHMLDIEPLYREQGWEVIYDKPSYSESYLAYWSFEPKGS